MSDFAKELGEVVPSNWCDPLLTGDSAALHGQPGTWSCPDIERLLNGIRERIQNHAALAAMVADAERWRHLGALTQSYGDGHTEPVEYFVQLEWRQGPWIFDGSDDGRGRPDTFPGWGAIVDEMLERQREEMAGDEEEDTARQAAGEAA